jgi:hypothetical protein
MQTHSLPGSRSETRSSSLASARLSASPLCNSITRNSHARSKRGKRTHDREQSNNAAKLYDSVPWSGHSSFCLWKTSFVRRFLRIFAISAAALFCTYPALGQGADRYAKVANQLVELINSGDYAGIQKQFNTQMAAALPLEKSSAFFDGLKQRAGRIQKLGEPRPSGAAMVFPATFEKGALDLQITLDNRGLIAGLLFKPQAAAKPEPLSQTDRNKKVAHELIRLINAGNYAGIQKHFNTEMAAALPLDKSSAFLNELTQQMGKIQKLGEPRPLDEATVYPVTFEKGTVDMQLALDSRGQIAGLAFTPQVAAKTAPEKE